jgi:hypothetical protein
MRLEKNIKDMPWLSEDYQVSYIRTWIVTVKGK